MKKIVWALSLCCVFTILLTAQENEGGQASKTEDLTVQGGPEVLGVHWARDFAPARFARVRSANMTYHGGKILPTVVSKAIFWGPSWNKSSFVLDKITGLTSWYEGHNNSRYAATMDEYTGTNGQVGSTTLPIREA